jgi:hypothetical protein
MDTCTSQCGKYTCQLAKGHKKFKHGFFGTDAEPCCIQWTDGGAEMVRKELLKPNPDPAIMKTYGK